MDVRDGQYRAIRTGGTGMWSTPGNEGWSWRIIGDQGMTDPGWGAGGSKRGRGQVVGRSWAG